MDMVMMIIPSVGKIAWNGSRDVSSREGGEGVFDWIA
jgi:hypothetical protein